MYKRLTTAVVILLTGSFTKTIAQVNQAKSIDKIAAVVGGAVILQSDVEQQYAKYLMEGGKPDENIRCYIVSQLLTQKLLSQQAIIDSVSVTDEDVDDQIQRRMRYAINRMGGPDKLEAFLKRPILQYQEEIRPEVREQLTAEKMQRQITSKVSVTPLDVKRYFESFPADSLPNYNSDVEVGELIVFPKLTKEEKESYRQTAESLRAKIKAGTDRFETLAATYSNDPVSAVNGGDLGFADRSAYVKEFAAMAFKLHAGELSPVFETEYGFHILEVLERRGEQVHVRHILIKPKPTQASLDRAKAHIDSVYNDVVAKKLPFSTAASLYSDDDETRYNGGMMLDAGNTQSRSTLISTDNLDPQVFLAIDTVKVGGFSKPELFTSAKGDQGYRFFYLRSKTNPHTASLDLDYPKIRELALDDKINRTISEWFEKRRKTTYVKIDPEYTSCPILQIWTK
jgi:peptidyl-prolyl cis-trans isomerase SurA